jgi:HlyD family secretion protein
MAQRAKAVAELAAKRAALDQARSAARLSLAEAHAGDDRARAARRAADQQLVRIQELANVGMATRVQLDQTQSTAAQAAADQARATATIQRYAGHDSDTQPDVRLAIRELEVATAALAQADQELAGARVTATLDGTVIAIHVRVGEKPGDRGIATLGNTDRMAAELEVYQTDIRKVALGQPVVLSATSLDAPLAGTVSRIGLEVKRQALLAADPAANTDARIVKIRVSLDKPSSERSRMLTGLQVIGKIAAGRS